jgi:hypothetical protein
VPDTVHEMVLEVEEVGMAAVCRTEGQHVPAFLVVDDGGDDGVVLDAASVPVTIGPEEPGMTVTIVEVSPRDGLQNEAVHVSTDAKVALLQRLVDAGLRRIEAVSFAHPRLVPAMADAEAVMERAPRVDGVAYAGLVLNRRGLERALAAGVDEVNVVVCVSDTFSRKNQNMSTDEAVRTAADVVASARDAGVLTTVTLATAFGCPFEGEVDPRGSLRWYGRCPGRAPTSCAWPTPSASACPRRSVT